jgi:hypothetical protein
MKKGSICKKVMLLVALLVLGGLSISANAAVTTFPSPTGLQSMDHYKYYVWNIDLGSINPQTITGASITFNDIYDWSGGNVNDVLYVNLLDWQGNLASQTLIKGTDTTSGTQNQFGNTNLIDSLVVPNDIGIGYASRKDITLDFNSTLLDTLKTYAADGRIALGFDPDCHFYNAGVEFSITTTPVVPAPAAVSLGGMGIMLVGWLRMRRTLK